MTSRALLLALYLPGLIVCLGSCKKNHPPDACCNFTDVPRDADISDGHGALLVQGSTSAHFYVLDGSGKQVASQRLNETLALEPGAYQVKVNNASHSVNIEAGTLVTCSTGGLITSGNTSDYYHIMDSLGRQMAYEKLGKPISLFPGSFQLRVNNTETAVEVKLKELTQVRTGTIKVRGNTGEYYYVLDDSNKQLNYSMLDKALAFLPGTYLLKVNNTSMKADVLAGQATEITTGNLLVKGLTEEEYYYVTDTLGNALNYQNLNKPLAFFPGDYHIRVNNTVMKGRVSENETQEFITGSLMLTGGGTGYYYVLDETGNQLNYNTLNKSLSFFPSEYTVRLGSSTRKATVAAGKLTAIDAFN